jgi:hypothetical protein
MIHPKNSQKFDDINLCNWVEMSNNICILLVKIAEGRISHGEVDNYHVRNGGTHT